MTRDKKNVVNTSHQHSENFSEEHRQKLCHSTDSVSELFQEIKTYKVS